MKHYQRVPELPCQTSVPIDLLHVCVIDSNMLTKKCNADH